MRFNFYTFVYFQMNGSFYLITKLHICCTPAIPFLKIYIEF